MRSSDSVEGGSSAGAFVNEVTRWSQPLGWMLLAIFYVTLCVNYEEVCTWCRRLELTALTSARVWRVR
jgi:hypothetical protein